MPHGRFFSALSCVYLPPVGGCRNLVLDIRALSVLIVRDARCHRVMFWGIVLGYIGVHILAIVFLRVCSGPQQTRLSKRKPQQDGYTREVSTVLFSCSAQLHKPSPLSAHAVLFVYCTANNTGKNPSWVPPSAGLTAEASNRKAI